MQELRSTEILDKEIQTEARKKAEKILAKADKDAADLLASVDEAIGKAKSEKLDFYNKKIELLREDQDASIPLEKQRFEVSFIQQQLINKINAYLLTLNENQIFDIVSKDCSFNFENKVKAYIYGFDFEKTKSAVSKKLGSRLTECEKTEFGKLVIEDDCGLDRPMGIIIESEDKSFRLRLSLSEVISRLLNSNRAELTEALFGGQL